MPNHYHLLIQQRVEGDIVKFMRKLGTGYTNYFNLKNERVGPLFQEKFKAIHINTDEHFVHIPHYIHLNPLDLNAPTWRENKVKNPRRAMTYLMNYHWSSFPDYADQRNFPSVTQRELLENFFKSPKEYKRVT